MCEYVAFIDTLLAVHLGLCATLWLSSVIVTSLAQRWAGLKLFPELARIEDNTKRHSLLAEAMRVSVDAVPRFSGSSWRIAVVLGYMSVGLLMPRSHALVLFLVLLVVTPAWSVIRGLYLHRQVIGQNLQSLLIRKG